MSGETGTDMKSVLYGSEDTTFVGQSHTGGKKRLMTELGEIPFATCEQDAKKVFGKDYTKKERKRLVHDKVGASRLFDSKVYLSNYEESLNYRKDSSLRNFNGSGNILAHEIKDSQEESISEQTSITAANAD